MRRAPSTSARYSGLMPSRSRTSTVRPASSCSTKANMPWRRDGSASPHCAQPLRMTSVSLVEAKACPSAAQLAVVVDAAVEDDGQPERLVAHRLRAPLGEVDDGEAAVDHPDAPVHPH